MRTALGDDATEYITCVRLLVSVNNACTCAFLSNVAQERNIFKAFLIECVDYYNLIIFAILFSCIQERRHFFNRARRGLKV